MDITSDQMRKDRRWCMTGWHSNQKTSSPEEFLALVESWRRRVEHGGDYTED
jgi:hypothetical protein